MSEYCKNPKWMFAVVCHLVWRFLVDPSSKLSSLITHNQKWERANSLVDDICSIQIPRLVNKDKILWHDNSCVSNIYASTIERHFLQNDNPINHLLVDAICSIPILRLVNKDKILWHGNSCVSDIHASTINRFLHENDNPINYNRCGRRQQSHVSMFGLESLCSDVCSRDISLGP